MQIALPLLKQLPASALVEELRREIDQLSGAAEEEGRDRYLTALMELSFARMPRRSRVHLPFLALFQRRVMMDILTHISQERVYRTVMGEELGWGACRTLLRSARDAGFLEAISPSVYQIHPAFPWLYGRKLRRQVPAPGLRQLESELVRVYVDTADYFMETLAENQDTAVTGVLAEEGNLTQVLALALEEKQWDNAQLLVQPLAQVFRMQKRYAELGRLRQELLRSVGLTAPEAEASGAIELWLYLMGTDASDAGDRLDLTRAEALNRQLLEYLSSRPDGATDPRTAAVYHQLGVIALHRRRLEEAEEWFLRSLGIIERGEDRAMVADDYYSLGQVKQYQRRYTEAREWLTKAVEIHQRLQDAEELVKDYRSLGLVTQLKLEYQEAESWYQQARSILEENRDEETAILVYHELGTVNHAQYLFEEAERWYQQALTLSDRLGKESQMAVEFHHLGLLAQTRGLLYEDAEEWYLAALEKREKLGDRRGAGDECRQLALLFHEQKRLDEAAQWYHRARE
ncbi:MAG: tetratricopeptide repeat protein, partial [Chloroflexota bacterium]